MEQASGVSGTIVLNNKADGNVKITATANDEKTSGKTTAFDQSEKIQTDSSSEVVKTQKEIEVPVITVQPINALAVPGGSATFSVVVKDASFQTYAWKVDKNDGKGWTDISEATASGYTIKNATIDQNGWKYRCVITNDAGSTESQEVILYVRKAGGDNNSSKTDKGSGIGNS